MPASEQTKKEVQEYGRERLAQSPYQKFLESQREFEAKAINLMIKSPRLQSKIIFETSKT